MDPNAWDEREDVEPMGYDSAMVIGQWEWVCATCGGHGAVESPIGIKMAVAKDHACKKPNCKNSQLAIAKK